MEHNLSPPVLPGANVMLPLPHIQPRHPADSSRNVSYAVNYTIPPLTWTYTRERKPPHIVAPTVAKPITPEAGSETRRGATSSMPYKVKLLASQAPPDPTRNLLFGDYQQRRLAETIPSIIIPNPGKTETDIASTPHSRTYSHFDNVA